MGYPLDDEVGRFEIPLKTRRAIRNQLQYEWNTTDPNLMLSLPTAINPNHMVIESPVKKAMLMYDYNEDPSFFERDEAEHLSEEEQGDIEWEQKGFPPHIIADLQKETIYEAKKMEYIKQRQKELIEELEIERANLEQVIKERKERKI